MFRIGHRQLQIGLLGKEACILEQTPECEVILVK
jgi:hypothetical protein